jgi:hypothetical protein
VSGKFVEKIMIHGLISGTVLSSLIPESTRAFIDFIPAGDA